MARQPCTYILASRRHGIYIGVTSDLIARMHQHRTGGADGFTKRYAVHRLVHYEWCADMSAAIAREKQLKNWHGPWKIGLIEQDNPDWADLAIALGMAPVDPTPR